MANDVAISLDDVDADLLHDLRIAQKLLKSQVNNEINELQTND